MQKFFRRREDEVERLLRANRADPRKEFVTALLDRLDTGRQQRVPSQRLGGRVLVAAAVTALAVGAGIAAGGVHVAGTSISNLVRVGQSGIHGNGDKEGKREHHHPGPGDHQYAVPICYRTGKRWEPWVEQYVPPFIAAFLVKHSPPTYIVGFDGNPDTCPP